MAVFVTLVNRTQRRLSGMWDGRQHYAEPGKNSYPTLIAEAIRRANPIMGSDDQSTGQLQYLVGIEEQGDPITPIEQSDEIELYQNRMRKNAIPIMVVPGNTGLYSVKRSDVAASLPLDSSFVSPKV